MESPKYIAAHALDAFEREDYQFVLRLAMPAAKDGNADAQVMVALLYQSGLGVNRNVIEAERRLLVAAKSGNAVAWNNLGSLYASKIPELRHRWDKLKNVMKKPSNSA